MRPRGRKIEIVQGGRFVTVIVSGALVCSAVKTGRGFRLRTQMDRSV